MTCALRTLVDSPAERVTDWGGSFRDHQYERGPMDRHLSVFLPYERPPGHEDQLTRAAMIVMRAIPLARDALLARIGALPSARLPEPELDIQTRRVREPHSLSDADGVVLRRLISVFLSPDEGLDLSAEQIGERPGEQRLDGVLRFGDELIVVIESKVVSRARSDQARLLRLGGVEVRESKVVQLGWHELLEDWWTLLERGLLGPAERVLMEDLVAFTEEHFPGLLPFTTLGRAGEHELRRQRRLMSVLREATGLAGVTPEPRPWIAQVMLDETIGTKSTQRISLRDQDEGLALYTFPAEQKAHAKVLYRAGRAQRLLDFLAEHPETWRARPNVHLAYRWSRERERLYLHCRLSVSEYVLRWTGEDWTQIREHRYDDIRENLWPWLRERQYAGPEDDQQLDAFLKRLGRGRNAHLRPGIVIWRIWPWPQAVDLDERGALVGQVRTAVAELLTALDEPLPPACTGSTPSAA